MWPFMAFVAIARAEFRLHEVDRDAVVGREEVVLPEFRVFNRLQTPNLGTPCRPATSLVRVPRTPLFGPLVHLVVTLFSSEQLE